MHMSRIRFVPVLVVMAITLSLLFGGWELYRTYGLVLPLEDQLKQNQAVTTVESVVNGQERTIKVALTAVEDLQTTYESLATTIEESLGQQVKIDLVDQRNDALKQAFREVQPILYGGMAKGEFSQMIDGASQKLQAAGYQPTITMNDQNIFVQIKDGDKYLYEVLPYNTMTAEHLLVKGVTSL